MNRLANSMLIIIMISTTCFLSCSKFDFHHDDDNLPNHVIIEWNLVALAAEGGTGYGNPLLASRADAMMHIAMHDAINAVHHRYQQYAYRTEGKKHADPFAAAVSAAYTVLLGCFPENKSMLDSALAVSLSKISNGLLKEAGIGIGVEAGNAILRLRAGDPITMNPVVMIPVSTVPGVYNVVPPFDFLFAPFWQTVKPFSLKSADQFRSVPPPALASDRYTQDFNEIKEIGRLNSTTRTADQSAYAKWWYEFVELGWNRVARISAMNHNMKLYATARMFALMNMAMADSYIAGWDSKNYYNFWRPYTAIRGAASDGNNATVPELTWESVEPTPPVQDYPSTHSTGANAAATVLTHFLGNHTGFSMASSSGVPQNSIRSFSSFLQAADENAHSRVVAGIHFRFATEAGQKMGNQVGEWTVKNHLRPLRK